VSIVRAASQRAQQVHNAQVQTVETQEVCALEMWSFVQTNYDGKVNWNVSSAEAGKAASVNREGFFG
jgi:hypothetical protein